MEIEEIGKIVLAALLLVVITLITVGLIQGDGGVVFEFLRKLIRFGG